jgi:hypothetical protein
VRSARAGFRFDAAPTAVLPPRDRVDELRPVDQPVRVGHEPYASDATPAVVAVAPDDLVVLAGQDVGPMAAR